MNSNRNQSTEWPENPDAGWLGTWASKNSHLIPYVMSLRIVREIYAEQRSAAISRADATAGAVDE